MNNDNELSPYIPRILIVDDMPDNLNVLGDILKAEGWKVRPVLNGELALLVAQKVMPDLILLDIMMPDMDGYEVCRRLKANAELCDIPVIFISALTDTRDIVKAFASGGVDYITKPFQAEEVKVRVSTHLKMHYQSLELQKQREELQKQSFELQELNATKDKFFSIIAHDLRSPFNSFLGFTRILADELNVLSLKEIQKIVGSMQFSATNLYSLLENLLEWSRMQRGLISFHPENIDVLQIVYECLAMVIEPANQKGISISYDIPDNINVFADSNMIQTVIRNLVSNALKFTNRGGKITVSAKIMPDQSTMFSITDTGIGMSEEMVSNLFRIDVSTKRKGTDDEPSSGLGLMLCKDFIQKHGGTISVESAEGIGSTFLFTFPCNSISS
jgi:signal transduction histidine kinase